MFVKCVHKGRRHDPQDTLLVVPYTTSKTFADRSISVMGPKLWNSLPVTIQQAPSYDIFKSKLKTHLFTVAFGSDYM